MIKNKMTNNFDPKTIAENNVPSNPPKKIILVTRLYLSAMFFICLLKPIKKPVLPNKTFTQQEQARFPANISQQTWLDFLWLCWVSPQKTVSEGRSLNRGSFTEDAADGKADESFCEGEVGEAGLLLFLFLAEDVFKIHVL